MCQNSRLTVCSSSSSEEADSIRKPPPYHVEKERRKEREPRPSAPEWRESPCETGYTTGDTGNELDRDNTDYLYRWAANLLPVKNALLVCLSSESEGKSRQFKVIFLLFIKVNTS